MYDLTTQNKISLIYKLQRSLGTTLGLYTTFVTKTLHQTLTWNDISVLSTIYMNCTEVYNSSTY
jgi:hypothetical protein